MIAQAGKLAQELEAFLKAKGFAVWLCSAWDEEVARAKMDGTDLILSIGGDGTILRAAKAVAPGQAPITGVNMGKLGFLTELSVEESKEKITQLLNGEGWVDERALLEAEVVTEQNRKPERY